MTVLCCANVHLDVSHQECLVFTLALYVKRTTGDGHRHQIKPRNDNIRVHKDYVRHKLQLYKSNNDNIQYSTMRFVLAKKSYITCTVMSHLLR